MGWAPFLLELVMRFLKNPANGRVFPWSETLAARGDLVEIEAQAGQESEHEQAQESEAPAGAAPEGEAQTDNEGEAEHEEAAPADNEGEDDSFIVSKATKQELVDFAKEAFGVELNVRDKIDTLREQVMELANDNTNNS